MTELRDEGLKALRTLVGSDDADFRDHQWEAIAALVEERRRVLVVQRTGWGKSAVYFVATQLLRARGAGPTLLVSPLLALMRDQIDAAARGGVRAHRITSDNKDEWEQVTEALERDEVDLLLVAPERFANPGFRADVLPQIAPRVGLLVIDEAHCISDWGHDFRPDYRRLTEVVDGLASGVPVLCTTATANDRVVDDIVDQLGADLVVLRGPLDRASLALDVIHLPTQPQRLAWLAEHLPTLPGTGIVYTLTVADAQTVAEWLRFRGIAARAYSGGETTETRIEIEEQLKRNEIKCVVATSALGMGYDKPDLAFVVHFQVPGSAIAYYQQVGRAGRKLDHAYGIALVGHEDRQIQDWFINTAFPPRDKAEAIVGLLGEAGGWVTMRELQEAVNARQSRVEAMLKILEVEGVVERDGRKWRRTDVEWEYPQERVEAVTARRREEQVRMREFLDGDACLMEFLRRELDDPDAAPCGRCARCLSRELVPHEYGTEVAREALSYLREQTHDIEPRKKWPDMKNIPAEHRAEWGRVLSVGDDARIVEEQKAKGRFDDDLVDALAAMVRRWSPDPMPTWVTCVPSLRNPDLVPSLAQRLAAKLGLPFHAAVTKVRETETQQDLDNSAQQLRNVAGAFVVADAAPDGPVLLVDDAVDSRWTLTVVVQSLREAGGGAVFPLALARLQGD